MRKSSKEFLDRVGYQLLLSDYKVPEEIRRRLYKIKDNGFKDGVIVELGKRIVKDPVSIRLLEAAENGKINESELIHQLLS